MASLTWSVANLVPEALAVEASEIAPWHRAAVDNITVGSRLAQSPNDLVARLECPPMRGVRRHPRAVRDASPPRAEGQAG